MLDGSCHCGAVSWRFDGMPESATACNCTVCRRYGVLWIYDYEGERIRCPAPHSAYVRGTASSSTSARPAAASLLAVAPADGKGAPHRREPAAGRARAGRPPADRPLRRARHLRRPAARRALRSRPLVLVRCRRRRRRSDFRMSAAPAAAWRRRSRRVAIRPRCAASLSRRSTSTSRLGTTRVGDGDAFGPRSRVAPASAVRVSLPGQRPTGDG